MSDLERPVESRPLHDPWLVAAWPGMGGVAAIAAGHLVNALQAEPFGMLPEGEFFEVDHVEVRHGIARSGPLPRNMFFAWRDPKGKRDLLVFLGEAQPPSGGGALCRRIVDVARRVGAQRIVTFAAMGLPDDPGPAPRAVCAVTAPEMLDEIRARDIPLLEEGRISGLNGSLLAAAANAGIPAMCLLGEMPGVAAAMPNPSAAVAVLEAFGRDAEMEIDLDELRERATEFRAHLESVLERLGGETEGAETDEATESEAPPAAVEHGFELDPATIDRIEALFDAARADRGRAPELKRELDRLGVFPWYEDRFLDLFRKAG